MINIINITLNGWLKFNRWWVYKIGSGVFTFILFKYIVFKDFSNPPWERNNLILLSVLILLTIAGHLINDFSDFYADLRSGKVNIFNNLNKSVAPVMVLLLNAAAILLTFFFLAKSVSVLIIFQIIFNVLYSAKPFRLKEKGLIALLITGLYERMLPYLIIISCISNDSINHSLEYYLFLIIYLLWSYLWECRNFLNGQLHDYSNDITNNIKSITVFYGLEKSMKLKSKLFSFELTALFFWLIMLPLFDIKNFIIIILVFIIPFIHYFSHKIIPVFSNKESLTSYCYNYSFLTGLLLYLICFRQINIGFAALLLVVFRSPYDRSTILFLADKIYYKIICRVYYSCKFVLSILVNYSIYFYRKHILKWSELKSKGQAEQ